VLISLYQSLAARAASRTGERIGLNLAACLLRPARIQIDARTLQPTRANKLDLFVRAADYLGREDFLEATSDMEAQMGPNGAGWQLRPP